MAILKVYEGKICGSEDKVAGLGGELTFQLNRINDLAKGTTLKKQPLSRTEKMGGGINYPSN